MPVAAYSQPGNYLGKYRLVRLVGEGGMGRVWEAIDPDIDRRVAIKILHPEHTHQAGLVERFFNEARAVNRIQHSSLAQVSECALLPDGTAYIVMDLLLGETLRTRMERCGTMSIVSAIRTTRQIASAMSAAHRAGITHRDLKPENVMLVIDPAMPDGERVKILDFGIAKLSSRENGPKTKTGMILGTPHYMSPEQWLNSGGATPASDVYSLAVMLYEMLTARRPFDADTPFSIAAKVVSTEPPRLQGNGVQVPVGLSDFVAAMMRKDPARRPTMEAVYGELEPYERTTQKSITQEPGAGAGYRPSLASSDTAEHRAEAGIMSRIVEFFRTNPPRHLADLFATDAAPAEQLAGEPTLIRPQHLSGSELPTLILDDQAAPVAAPAPVIDTSTPTAYGRIGSFRVLRMLGKSEIGIMYEGEKIDTGRRAAIRVLDFKNSADSKAIERFVNTAKKVSLLRHPAIAEVLEFDQLPFDTAFIATDFVEGDTLRSHLERMGQMHQLDAITVLRPIIAALVSAHAKGIVHCDLRPEKIMLVFRPEEPRVLLPTHGHTTLRWTTILEGRLLDFGMAQMLPLPLPDLQAVQAKKKGRIGTVVYLPPENFLRDGSAQDNPDDLYKKDVFMLGNVMYEMLFGRAPWAETDELDITTRIQRVVFEVPRPLADIAPNVSGALSELVQRMLEKRAPERPTMAGVESALNEIWRTVQKSTATGYYSWGEAPPREPSVHPGIQRVTLVRSWASCIAWSPHGTMLALGCKDRSVRLYLARDGEPQKEYPKRPGRIHGLIWSSTDQWLVAFGRRYIDVLDLVEDCWYSLRAPIGLMSSACGSPDGQFLAVGDELGNVWLYPVKPEAEPGILAHAPPVHAVSPGRANHGISSLAWSPDGRLLAAGSNSGMIRVFSISSGDLVSTLTEHQGGVVCLSFSPDSKRLVSGSRDKTVRVWDCERCLTDYLIDSHFETVTSVGFAAGGTLLVTQARDNIVRLWLSSTYEPVTEITDDETNYFDGAMAVDPTGCILATLSEREALMALWALDGEQLLQARLPAVHYKNARVVLVGEQRVGKTGLGRALTRQPYTATEPTHGRHVWQLNVDEAPLSDGRMQQREILLWDLAGQDGYRLVHQLHLRDVDVALIVFDAQSEKEVLASIYYWSRAIRHAQRMCRENIPQARLLLVAARCDLGTARLSSDRIDALCRELGFSGYYETSARENIGIDLLRDAIQSSIPWDVLPEVVSTEEFQRVRTFLMAEKNSLRVLATCEDLYTAYLRGGGGSGIRDTYLRFVACVERLEAGGLLRRFGFGDYLLLQPEMIDKYASALVNAVNGEGCIAEQEVYERKFLVPRGEAVASKEHESLLLRVVVSDLLQAEVAVRLPSEDGDFLVFPSQVTDECPLLPREGRAPICFQITGALQNLYAAVIIRLIACGLRPSGIYKNSATFKMSPEGSCGLVLREDRDGHGRIELFFQGLIPVRLRAEFEERVACYLSQQIAPEPLQRSQVFTCTEPACDEQPLDSEVVRKRLERDLDTAPCPLCGKLIPIASQEVALEPLSTSVSDALVRIADLHRERQTADTVLRAKQATQDFDVLLCYQPDDRERVLELVKFLAENRILSVPQPIGPRLEFDPAIFLRIRALAICVNEPGSLRWWEHHADFCVLIKQLEARHRPVIELAMSDFSRWREVHLNPRQQKFPPPDFAITDENPLEHLIRCLDEQRRVSNAVVPNSLLRQIISEMFLSDSDLESFVIDDFRHIYRYFSTGMDSVQKVNLLLVYTTPQELLSALKLRWSPAIARRWTPVLGSAGAA